MKKAVFPGSFDPITLGHLDVINRGLSLFDEVIIAIGVNTDKKHMFSLEERKLHIENAFKNEPRIKVSTYKGLTVDSSLSARILRGLRAVSDFEYEFQMLGMNRTMNPDIETVFLMAEPQNQPISSNFVKDIARLGGDISKFTSLIF